MDRGTWLFMNEYTFTPKTRVRPSDNKCPKKSKLIDEMMEQVKQPAPKQSEPLKAARPE